MSAIQRLLRGVWQGTKLVRMKILLYILAVCMVGVMIPNAFAEVYEVVIEDPATPPNDPLSRNCAGEYCLYPPFLIIGVGDQVRFVNADDADHDVNSGTVTDGPDCNANGCSRVGGFSSAGPIYMGESYTTPVFTEEGEYRYFSQLRPWVKGIIIVEAVSPPEPVVGTLNILTSPACKDFDKDGECIELTEEEYCLRIPNHVKCTLTEKEIEGLEKPEYTPTYEITENMSAYVYDHAEWYEWDSTNRPFTDELDKSRGLEPTDFSGFLEYTWRGYMKEYGTKTWESGAVSENFDIVDIFIYRFDSYDNAKQFYKSHTDYWQNRGQSEIKETVGSTDSMIANDKIGEPVVPADKCMSRYAYTYSALTDITINKNALYCMKNEIVIFTTATSMNSEQSAVLAGFMDNTIDTISIHQLGGYSARSDYLLPNNPQYASLTPVITPATTTPATTTQKSGDGCGAGTVLVNGVCQLTPTKSKSTFMSIEPLYLIIVGVAAAVVVGALLALSRRSGTPKPAREELEEYESRDVARKPAEKKETSSSCSNCGKSLKPTAKFCGGCGTPRS